MSHSNQNVSRRTLVKGTAWAVPAVAIASAAPAMAQSLPPVTPDIPNSFGCKWPGGGNPQCNNPLDKGFRIYIPFDNNTGYSVVVNISGYTVTAGGDCTRDYEAHGGTSLNIAPGGSADFWVTWHDDNSGNNKTMSVTYTYTVTSGDAAGTVYGPYTIPVAKVFNQTCTGSPEPTIPAGPCDANNPGHSDCPQPGSRSSSSDEGTASDSTAPHPAESASPDTGSNQDTPTAGESEPAADQEVVADPEVVVDAEAATVE
jgi:hypothetical protein